MNSLNDDYLLLAAKSYNNLINKNFIIELDKSSSIEKIEIEFKKDNFYHLAGLQYITDIPSVNPTKNKKNTIFNKILNGRIKYSDIEKSCMFNDNIRNRIKFLENIDKLIFNRIILDFDKSKLKFNSKLNGIYLFYKLEDNNYIHLIIGKENNFYPESFFVEYDDKYIKEQTSYNIMSIKEKNIKKRKKSSYKYKDDLLEKII